MPMQGGSKDLEENAPRQNVNLHKRPAENMEFKLVRSME